MKNVLISCLFMLFMATDGIAQFGGSASACNMRMNIPTPTCVDNGTSRRVVFTVNSGSDDVEVYSNGNLAAEGNNSTTTVLYFPTRSYPYTVYIECRSACRRDGCIVVIEPC